MKETISESSVPKLRFVAFCLAGVSYFALAVSFLLITHFFQTLFFWSVGLSFVLVTCSAILIGLTEMGASKRQGRLLRLSAVEIIILWFIGIVAILMTTAGFFQPQTRATVARARTELRNVELALELYHYDHGTLPHAENLGGMPVPASDDGVSSGYIPSALTTPVEYLPYFVIDPFYEDRPHRYASNLRTCWIIASNGPDEDEDMRLELYPSPQAASGSIELFLQIPGNVEYDPSNGTQSSGDIFRTGP